VAQRRPSPLPHEDDHVRGDPDAPVPVVEYGDYECPYCAAAAPVLRDLVESSDGRVRLVFRNFPLADVHPYALTAALAAEAVAPHGVFWEMHDLLFERQERLTDADLAAYARSLGVDGARVVGDAAQPFGDKVEADFASGVALGVRGTPWLFVDGEPYTGRVGAADLRQAVSVSSRPRRLVPRARRQRR
jgi:protein-disulfide isomerase